MNAWCYVWVIGSSAVMLTVNVLAILYFRRTVRRYRALMALLTD